MDGSLTSRCMTVTIMQCAICAQHFTIKQCQIKSTQTWPTGGLKKLRVESPISSSRNRPKILSCISYKSCSVLQLNSSQKCLICSSERVRNYYIDWLKHGKVVNQSAVENLIFFLNFFIFGCHDVPALLFRGPRGPKEPRELKKNECSCVVQLRAVAVAMMNRKPTAWRLKGPCANDRPRFNSADVSAVQKLYRADIEAIYNVAMTANSLSPIVHIFI